MMNKIRIALASALIFLGCLHVQTATAGIVQDIENGRIDAVKAYLQQGGNVNATGGRFGESLLCNAIMHGRFDIVRLLVDHGADINAQTGMGGFTPLARAANFADLESVKLLVEKGAQVNGKTGGSYFDYPLTLCLDGNFLTTNDPYPVFIYLLDHGADINVIDGFGRTPLSSAILHSCEPCVRELLNRGADPNTSSKGKIPLEQAIDEIPMISNFTMANNDAMVKESIDIVKRLLEHGANPNAKTQDGKTLEDLVHEKFSVFEPHVVIDNITLKDSSSPIPVAEATLAPEHTANRHERDAYYAKKKSEELKLLEK